LDFILNDYHRNIPSEALLEDLVRVYHLVAKETLSQSDYRKHGKYGTQTFRRRFGSWNEALRLCCIQPSVYQNAASRSRHEYTSISTHDLLDDVRNVAKCLGKRTITSAEYTDNGRFSRDTCFRRFESWNEVLENAGLEPFDKIAGSRIDDEKLFVEIERLWVLLGRQPTTSDIKNGLSHYALNTYARRFGSWRNALLAFVEWIYRDRETEDTDDKLQKPLDSLPTNKISATFVPTKATHTTTRDIGLKLRFKVMQRDCFKCRCCGASPATDPSIRLHIDHILPWSRGGETVIENLQTLCSKCNLGKSDGDL